MIEQIRADAELVVDKLGPISELQFGYNHESVMWLEGYIEHLRESGTFDDPATSDMFVSLFGSFLGECIVRCYGGAWAQRDGGWYVEFDSKNAVYPFAKVEKQMHYGLEDSIASFFSIIPVAFKGRV